MHIVSIDVMMQVIDFAAIRNGKPVMVWGPPGVGKSQGIYGLAKKYKCSKKNGRLIDIRLGQYDSVDLRGIPDVDKEAAVTRWNMPSTLPFIGNPKFAHLTEGIIILFLDEITSAQPPVAAVAYQLTQDRGVGEHKLMPNVVIVAAGNRDGDRGVTNRMPTPLANRFTHIEVDVDIKAWSKWAIDADMPPLGIAFLQWRPHLLSTFMVVSESDKTKKVPTTAKDFASPRSWETAFRYYMDDEMPADIKRICMDGSVGEGPSGEFWGFVDVWQKVIPISRILKDPTGVELPTEASMIYATLVNVSGEMSTKNIKTLNKFIKRFPADYTVLAWQLAVKRDEDLYTTDEFIEFSKDHMDIFKN